MPQPITIAPERLTTERSPTSHVRSILPEDPGFPNQQMPASGSLGKVLKISQLSAIKNEWIRVFFDHKPRTWFSA
ncbi:MAG: hypothetical protein M1829_002077 [Trizodia sp. TS-e1964]|nr:MAG: hypothetical protein M1829_002077 [Trizodia sp. TS-e1964]